MLWLLIIVVLVAATAFALVAAGIRRAPRVVVDDGRFDRIVADMSRSPRAARSERKATREQRSAAPGTSVGRFAVESGATIGIVGAFSAVEWHQVDANVYQAFEHLSHMHVNGFMDLQHVVDVKGYDLASHAFQTSVQGHVAEWKVGHDLITTGHGVAMAAGPTQPGWDLLVDGHAVNVKDRRASISPTSCRRPAGSRCRLCR
jgi:hypothetical protein